MYDLKSLFLTSFSILSNKTKNHDPMVVGCISYTAETFIVDLYVSLYTVYIVHKFTYKYYVIFEYQFE